MYKMIVGFIRRVETEVTVRELERERERENVRCAVLSLGRSDSLFCLLMFFSVIFSVFL